MTLARRVVAPIIVLCVIVLPAAIRVEPVDARPALAERARQMWVARTDGPALPVGIVVADGGATTVVAGTTVGATSKNDLQVVAYDTTRGNVLWRARFDGEAHRNDRAIGIVAPPDGSRVFVAGTTVGPARSDYVTIAYDAASGHVLWTRTLDGSTHGKDTASGIGISPDGSAVFVTGTTLDLQRMSEVFMTVSYATATGAWRWENAYRGPDYPSGISSEETSALAVAPGGDLVYVAGSGYVPPQGSDSGRAFDIVAYRGSDGAQMWASRPVGWPCSYPAPTAVAASPDGSTVAVTGWEDEGCNESFRGYATAVVSAADGTPLWNHVDTGDYWARTSGATAIAYSPDGAQVIQTGNLTSPHYGTVSYAADGGTARWTERFDGSRGPDLALGTTVSPDARLAIVTGGSCCGPGKWDFMTLAYRMSDGSLAWRARYDGPSHLADWAVALATSGDGRTLYVTGVSFASDGAGDLLTIAYRIG